jgi:hypothetical protein
MKAALVLILFAAPAFAQDRSAMTAAQAACGPASINFDAKADSTQHPTPQPDADKAIVFVVADLGQCSDCGRPTLSLNDVGDAVLKVGMDGVWAGASRGDSYLFASATPGDHHLCLNWQSRLEERSRAFAMTNFTAEAGKTYYFRARLFPGHSDDFSLDLDPMSSDAGKYLVASSEFSLSHPKK